MENINENRIRQHIEKLFAAAPNTAQANDLREEMIMNTIERYHDAINSGKDPEQAYSAAINSIGDVSELIASLGGQASSPAPAAPAQQKKNSAGRTIAIVAAIICGTLLLITLIGCIAGASIVKSVFGGDGLFYNIVKNTPAPATSTYTFGDDEPGFDNPYAISNEYAISADGITKLHIDWISGAVIIKPYDGDDIMLAESSTAEIAPEDALRYKLSGDKLTVHFCQSKTWAGVDVMFSNINSIITAKQLIVSVPRAMLNADELTLEISGVSNSTSVEAAALRELDIDSASGGIILQNVSAAEEMELDTVSGEISAEDCAAKELDACTVSGDMYISGNFSKAEFEGTSASVYFANESELKKLSASTVSGDVTVKLPAAQGFTLETSTVSGDTGMGSFACTVKGGKTYTHGDGSAAIKVSTVSGDIIFDTLVKE